MGQRVGKLAGAGAGVLALALLALGLWPRPGVRAPPGSAAAVERDGALARASAALLARELPDVTLDMSMTEVLRGHPRLRRHAPADRDGLRAYEEQLGPERSALYFFEAGPALRLARLQLAAKLADDRGVAARVLDLQGRLGAPSGVWDCPAAAGQLPTRRYQFSRGPASALDVIALIGSSALATYYVAASDQIRRSLVLAQCQHTPPERATLFPVVPAP